MSHFTEIKVNFQQEYEAELVAALKEMFGNVEVHDEAKELKAYTQQNASNAGLGHTEKCHLIIRQKDLKKASGQEWCATNDAGYERTSDGKYRVFIDKAGFTAEQQGKVAQSYAEKVATKQFEAQGYQVTKVKNANGTIRLEATIWS